jgi:hypothetical protein
LEKLQTHQLTNQLCFFFSILQQSKCPVLVFSLLKKQKKERAKLQLSSTDRFCRNISVFVFERFAEKKIPQKEKKKKKNFKKKQRRLLLFSKRKFENKRIN